MGTLYLVATPIGNLKDITLRAIEALNSAEYIACEDTRKSGMLLKYVRELPFSLAKQDQGKPMLISYHEHNELFKNQNILNLLLNGKNVVLISDAGTPTISDPGFKLVRECIREGIRVESIPGPSSVITALTVSGLPTDKFLFLGYLPIKMGKRTKQLQGIKDMFSSSEYVRPTIIFFEAPHRLLKTLEELKNVYGDIYIVVARELTKVHEEVKRGRISEVLEQFSSKPPKGEIVVMFHPSEFSESQNV